MSEKEKENIDFEHLVLINKLLPLCFKSGKTGT